MDLVHLASLYASASLSADRSNSTYHVVIMKIKEISKHHPRRTAHAKYYKRY